MQRGLAEPQRHGWHDCTGFVKIKRNETGVAAIPPGRAVRRQGARMVIYGLGSCDTCRKARKALPGSAFVDIRDTGLPAAVLQAALARFGAALVNRRSTTWRGLSADARAQPPEALLAAHPAVMKRPLIEDGDGVLHLGWGPEVREKLLG